ncbi:MAG: rRNA pseudouridine synthase [Pseudomonadota bacterium]|nr:rRNA pseudouridine synthase [Pseudomonadota bacterium]
MSEPVRLAKRVADLARCSRAQAEQYIEGGWVRVNGEVIEEPQFMVSGQAVEIDPDARLTPAEPATMLLHKPVDFPFVQSPTLVTADNHAQVDPSGFRMHDRHFAHLTPLMPLDDDASGLVVLSQDGRVRRRLTEDAAQIEQEFIVEIEGASGPYTLSKLARGLSYQGRALPACKVSWQNEVRLRFAIKDVRPGQLRDMCKQVGLTIVAIKRIRLGRIPLAKMPAGKWRYLPVTDRF